MPVASSPSDFTAINVDYSEGRGYYTNINAVSDLLQIPSFTSLSNPTWIQVGQIIKRMEGFIDDKIGRSFRPIIHHSEYKDFEFTRHPAQAHYGGYVGFVQLTQMKVRKIISLRVWEGASYRELASAQASIDLDSSAYNKIRKITLTLPNNTASWDLFYHGEVGKTASGTFNSKFGSKTTARDIISLINEEFPAQTSQFTGATAEKVLLSGTDSIATTDYNISDFFYAYTDDKDSTKIHISSLLQGDDGSDCTITVTDQVGEDSSTIAIDFTDKEDMRRLGDFWTIGNDGRIFFMKRYPYHQKNSVIVSYVAGNARVPATVHEATTKLVAAEILRHDDQTILIAETGGNITTKEKYEILRKEAMEIISSKKDLVYMLD